MKICGVIAEYNPFHNGHKLQLRAAKEKTKADILIVVMSGMFTQRGDIAIAPKFTRAKMALSQGADIVIELPTCYALQPAEYFALGGVGILDALGADYISYGTEAVSEADRLIIDNFVSLTNKVNNKFEKQIKKNLHLGMSYPQSRLEAFKQISKHDDVNILKSPNAILEIAYRNAIHRLKSKIKPYPIPRVGDAYHEAAPQSKIASATAIRNLIRAGEDYSSYVPSECYNISDGYLSNNTLADIDMLYPYFIHALSTSPETLGSVSDASEELFNRMMHAASESETMREYIDNVSTKRYSHARVSRAIMHSILNISGPLINLTRMNLPLYARVLAIKEDKKHILGHFTKHSTIPVITSVANPNLQTDLQRALLNIDIAATNLYNFTVKNASLYNQDYTQKLTTY